jgi:hypothetical protein
MPSLFYVVLYRPIKKHLSLLARPGAFLDDPALLLPDPLVRDAHSIAPPLRHNDGSTRPPYVQMHRGHSDRANHSHGHSLRVLGEPMSMRAELGGIHFALERTPVDEELTILTDSLSAIHLLCRWRRKRILTPYVRRAKCRDIVSAILERLLARTQAGARTLFAKKGNCALPRTRGLR